MYNLPSYLSKIQKIYMQLIWNYIAMPSYLPTYNMLTHYVFAYLGLFKLGILKKRKKTLGLS
jgi:hypothetical protein